MLEDHSQKGKKYIPPLLAFGQFRDAKYIDKVIPEIFWIAVLNEKLGVRNAAEINLKYIQILKAVVPSQKVPFGISWYSKLTTDQAKLIKKALKKEGLYDVFQEALTSFLNVYPEVPLNSIFSYKKHSNSDLKFIKNLLSDLLDKTSIPSTFMLGNVIYFHFVEGNLTVTKNSSLANFPMLIDYPNTELARQIASNVRASSNVLINEPFIDFDNIWIKYFWNRGIKLEPCKI